MAQDADFGDTQHNSLRAALQFLGEPRSHDSSLAHHSTSLRTLEEQIEQVAEELKKKLSLDHSAEDPRRGNDAASSSDPQPFFERNPSGGHNSRAVEQFEEELVSMGCPDSPPHYATAATAATICATTAATKCGVSPRPTIELTPFGRKFRAIHNLDLASGL